MKKLLVFVFTILSCAHVMANTINWTYPPTLLSSSSDNSSSPCVAVDANGDFVAVWLENGFIKSSTKLHNGSWTTAVTISTSGASSPVVVSDSNGNATAVWLQGTTVTAATKLFNNNWGSTTALSSTSASSPSLAVDVNGDVVAVWARSGNVETSTKLFGASWQAHTTISSTAAASPHVAIGGSGSTIRVYAVWGGTSGSTNVIYSATKLISGAWSTEQVISDTTHNATNAYVALDSNANATAIWYEYNLINSVYTNVVVESSTILSGSTTWSVPVVLSAPGVVNPANLIARVAYDATGNTVALWNTSFDGVTYNIESALKLVRGSWTAPVDLVQENIYASSASLAVSSLGDALATFMFYNGTAIQIQSSESDITGFMENIWSLPLNLSQGNNNAFPHVAATLTGNTINAAALWVSYNGSVTEIVASTGSRSVVLPASNLSVTQHATNLGVFTDYNNTLSWTASTDPKLAGYLIYRNGTLIGQVGAITLQYIDNNQVQNGMVTYGVAAINNESSRSVIITDVFN